MKAVAWTSKSKRSFSETGAGIGVRISKKDRDRFFRKEWSNVIVDLEGTRSVVVPLSDAFWRSCPELRDQRIGTWMIEMSIAPWPPRRPPASLSIPEGEEGSLYVPLDPCLQQLVNEVGYLNSEAAIPEFAITNKRILWVGEELLVTIVVSSANPNRKAGTGRTEFSQKRRDVR